jgi:hypothetical protein
MKPLVANCAARINHENEQHIIEICSNYSYGNGVHVETKCSQRDDAALMEILCADDRNSPFILLHVSKDTLELNRIFERHDAEKSDETC